MDTNEKREKYLERYTNAQGLQRCFERTLEAKHKWKEIVTGDLGDDEPNRWRRERRAWGDVCFWGYYLKEVYKTLQKQAPLDIMEAHKSNPLMTDQAITTLTKFLDFDQPQRK